MKITAHNEGFGVKAGRCLAGHFAGFWKFASRPSLTDTPACRQAANYLLFWDSDTAQKKKCKTE